MTQASVLNENRKLLGQTRMSLPVPTQLSLNEQEQKPESAPAILVNTKATISRPTPNTLPKKLRERFEYTPGLHAFLDRILDLSVISKQSSEEIANQFLMTYDSLVAKGEVYSAIRAYQKISSS
jgi:hypothetical protein